MTKAEVSAKLALMLLHKPADVSGDAWVAILQVMQEIVALIDA
jgi:hypothetical protein